MTGSFEFHSNSVAFPAPVREKLAKMFIETRPDILLAQYIAEQLALLLSCTACQQCDLGRAVSDAANTLFQRGRTSSVVYQIDAPTSRNASLLIEIDSGCKGSGYLFERFDGIEIVANYDGRVMNKARRLVDDLELGSTETGLKVTLRKSLNRGLETGEIRFARNQIATGKLGVLIEQLGQKD